MKQGFLGFFFCFVLFLGGGDAHAQTVVQLVGASETFFRFCPTQNVLLTRCYIYEVVHEVGSY